MTDKNVGSVHLKFGTTESIFHCKQQRNLSTGIKAGEITISLSISKNNDPTSVGTILTVVKIIMS